MKKIIFTFSVVFISLTGFVCAADRQTFLDVPRSHEDFVYIEDLVSKGVIDADRVFRPDDLLTRAEFSKIVVLGTLGVAYDKIRGYNTFPDINTDEWYWPHIQSARYYNFLHGYEDGLFRPANKINIAEALKIILLSTGLPMEESAWSYRDFSDEEWYAPYAYSAFAHGVYKGKMSEDRPLLIFDAGHKITRAEMARIFSKALKLAEYYNANSK